MGLEKHNTRPGFLSLFHPDYNRRPRSFTGSADPVFIRQALAGLVSYRYITAGGEFHPALRNNSYLSGRAVKALPEFYLVNLSLLVNGKVKAEAFIKS